MVDPRVLAIVLDGRGNRDISFGDAVKLQTETARADWPVKGPRTMLWVLGFMLRMAGGAMAWHNRWIAMMQSPEYQAMHHHRDAGLAGQLNIETTEAGGLWLGEAGFSSI